METVQRYPGALTRPFALASPHQIHNQDQAGGNPENRCDRATAHFEISLNGNFVSLT
jgi:hypothetical protein